MNLLNVKKRLSGFSRDVENLLRVCEYLNFRIPLCKTKENKLEKTENTIKAIVPGIFMIRASKIIVFCLNLNRLLYGWFSKTNYFTCKRHGMTYLHNFITTFVPSLQILYQVVHWNKFNNSRTKKQKDGCGLQQMCVGDAADADFPLLNQ